jgi:hypothetical protein
MQSNKRMIYLESTYVDEEGQTVYLVRVFTACCKKLFTVIKSEQGEYFDIETLQFVEGGWKISIENAIKNDQLMKEKNEKKAT